MLPMIVTALAGAGVVGLPIAALATRRVRTDAARRLAEVRREIEELNARLDRNRARVEHALAAAERQLVALQRAADECRRDRDECRQLLKALEARVAELKQRFGLADEE